MSEIAIRAQDLGKLYKLYQRPADKILDTFGINRWLFWKKNYYRKFWALRNLNLTVKRGERLGIIGPNGAGKSTLLKIVSGNLQATEGQVEVHGRVQALMDLGTGFHPEFSARQNIRASLAYQGLSTSQIRVKEEEIIDFAEIDEFIDQPVKTYSAGMYTRLAFSTATAIEPEILIIDEVLGAGDAYFQSKCVDRMRKLTEESGATVLYVSHALPSVQALCERAIWIERGLIVAEGPCLGVIKSYQQFVHNLEDQRLKAKNLKRQSARYSLSRLEGYGDDLVITLNWRGSAGDRCDIQEAILFRDGQEEQILKIGDVQDAGPSQSCSVLLEGSQWSDPIKSDTGSWHRSLAVPSDQPFALGQMVFHMYAFREDSNYTLRIRYRCSESGELQSSVSRNGISMIETYGFPVGEKTWREEDMSLHQDLPLRDGPSKGVDAQSQKAGKEEVSRWEGEGSIGIKKVLLLNGDGKEQAVFRVGTSMTLRMILRARKTGSFPMIPVAVLHRLDGIVVCQFWGPKTSLSMEAGTERSVDLILGSINLGNGSYVFSVGLYKDLSIETLETADPYEVIDRSYELTVTGNPQRMSALFSHSSEWKFN